MTTEDDYDDDDDDSSKKVTPEVAMKKAGEVVESLLFTAGRVGVPAESIAGVAKSRPDDPLARGIRLEAVRCLALGKVAPAVLDTLESLAVGPDADVRVLASELLARFDPKRAVKLATPDKLLSDRPSFNRLVAAGAVHSADVKSAAANVHVQPVALPVFVAEKDVSTLAAVARDRKAPEAARHGAVEGLGVMAERARGEGAGRDRHREGRRQGDSQGRVACPAALETCPQARGRRTHSPRCRKAPKKAKAGH